VRRRFGRRRGKETGAGREAIDAGAWLERLVREGGLGAVRLEPVTLDGVPGDFAALGRGEDEGGGPLRVAFSPHAAGDAVLAALALGTSEGEAGSESPVLAVAPRWSTRARRLLSLVGETPFPFRAAEAPALVQGDRGVEPEPEPEGPALSARQVAARIPRRADRELFERAAEALAGLAAKHAGSVRGVGRSLELVLLARRVAELRADDNGVVLHTLAPQRSTLRLAPDDLAGAFDRLEGQLRRRLGDRKVREGEDGLRSALLPLLGEAGRLRRVVPWPVGGGDAEPLDLAGVDEEGRVLLGAARRSWGLPELVAVLDAAAALQPWLPHLLADAGAPLRPEAPRLALAGEGFEPVVESVLPLLVPAFELFAVEAGRGGALSLVARASGAAATRPAARRPAARRPAPAEPEARETAAEATEEPADEPAEEPAGGEEREARGGASRGRRRRGRRRRGGGGRGSEAGAEEAPEAETEKAGSRFEEVSLFELDEEESEEGPARGGRSRGGRRRRGGRRSGGSDVSATEESGSPDASPGSRRRGRRRESDAEAEAAEPDDEEAPEDLSELVAEIPELEEVEEPGPSYDEDDELDEEEPDTEAERLALERERRRRARLAKAAPVTPKPQAAEKPRPPRRRAAIVAHADRDSLFAAVLLARDLRLLEGLWIYPQDELMTFFRSVATDLKEGTPIHVVGFTPKPARDVVQAASLYGDRLSWYDRHVWPPEDVLSMRQTIGEDNLHLTEGVESVLPAVLATCTRRSRFSDKLVDLATGRFTQHDYERWGRLWCWRLSRLAERTGERRHDIDPLLVGRPSDLAKEAQRAETPPPPPELEYVSSRDFRLVHFAGFSLVVVEVPEGLDAQLCARIARERYDARLTLTVVQDGDCVTLGGEELGGRRSLDFGAMAEHLASKLEEVDRLPDDDHVARFRVRGLPQHPERLDDVVTEIAMGRSILEG